MYFEDLPIVDIQVHVRSSKSTLKTMKKILNVYKKLKFFHTKFKTENSDWPDIVFSHYRDTDDLGIYFIKVTPGVLDVCDNASDDLLVSYDHNRKIISIDLDVISRLFHSNVFTVDGVLNAKFIKPIYYEDSDMLKINFVNAKPLPTKIQKTMINDIEIEMDSAEKISGLLFHNAKKNIAKPLTEEERKFFAEKSRTRKNGNF